MNHLSIIRNGVLIAATSIALFASTYKLSEAPGIWYDEGYYTQIGMNVAAIGKQVLQTEPGVYVPTSYITVGYPLTIPLSISYKIFGVGVLQGRSVMVLFILSFIAASYFLSKKLFGVWPAAYTALLLATFPMLYGNGKSVLGEVPGLFFLSLTLLAVYRLEKDEYRDWRWYAVAGVAAGLCVATKPIFILLLAALFLVAVMKWKKITQNWKGVLAGLVALVTCLGLWIYLQFGSDASLSTLALQYTNPYASENIYTLIIQNALRFIKESTPLYTLILMSVWGVSLYIRRKKKEISAAEMTAFIFCILTILSYLRLAGWYRYLFPATMVALSFFPSSLRIVWDATTARVLQNFVVTKKILVLPFLLIICLSAAQLYQTARASYVAQYYAGTRTRDMSAALAAISPDAKIFLYNTPEIAALLPTKNYYQYLTPLAYVQIGAAGLPALRAGTMDLVIVDDDTYTKEKELFNRYPVKKLIDRYDILQKE